jgi:hypothetical protein
MKYIICLFIVFSQIQVQAQAGYRNNINPIQVYLEASREIPPFSDKLFSKLLESREQLESINASPSIESHGTIKASYYSNSRIEKAHY